MREKPGWSMAKVSHMLGFLPSICAAPSYWKEKEIKENMRKEKKKFKSISSCVPGKHLLLFQTQILLESCSDSGEWNRGMVLDLWRLLISKLGLWGKKWEGLPFSNVSAQEFCKHEISDDLKWWEAL